MEVYCFHVSQRRQPFFSFGQKRRKTLKQLLQKWLKQKEADTKAVDTKSWEEEQYLPSEWTEKGQENIPVVLSGKENLQGKNSRRRFEFFGNQIAKISGREE